MAKCWPLSAGTWRVMADCGSYHTWGHRWTQEGNKSEHSSTWTPLIVAQQWGVRLDTAHCTLKVTTQAGVRTVIHPLECRFWTRKPHLKFPTYQAKVYTDQILSTVKLDMRIHVQTSLCCTTIVLTLLSYEVESWGRQSYDEEHPGCWDHERLH